MTKEEKIENYLCSKGLSDKEIKSDTTGLRRITKEIILEAINWACSNLKEEQNKNFQPIQMICDSQGCREVDLLGKPINDELKTLMSPKQLKELIDRKIKIMTREEVKKQLLNEIDKSAKKHGGLDEIFCRAPQVGKSSWTWREYRDAVEQDKPMENTTDNPIDVYIRYLEYIKNK